MKQYVLEVRINNFTGEHYMGYARYGCYDDALQALKDLSGSYPYFMKGTLVRIRDAYTNASSLFKI